MYTYTRTHLSSVYDKIQSRIKPNSCKTYAHYRLVIHRTWHIPGGVTRLRVIHTQVFSCLFVCVVYPCKLTFTWKGVYDFYKGSNPEYWKRYTCILVCAYSPLIYAYTYYSTLHASWMDSNVYALYVLVVFCLCMILISSRKGVHLT